MFAFCATRSVDARRPAPDVPEPVGRARGRPAPVNRQLPPARSNAREGSSKPQRVPVHSFSSYPLPCRARSRAGPFGLGPPSRPHLCGACTLYTRGSGGSRSQRSRVLHAIHCAAASPRPSKPRAWFADTRISLCASLRLPARRLLRARREAHPIRDRIEAPVRARQRRRRCPPEPSTPCCT